MKLPAAESGQLKLAVSPSADGEILAELLTAELAGMPGVVMLDRTALAKVVREQALDSGSSAGTLRAGRLLGADGLLVLDSRKLASGYWVSLRLVAVRQGVSAAWWGYTVAGNRTLEWAKGASAQLKQFLPKLTGETNASPIAFVGFTTPASSQAGATLERELNALILNRISAEPGLLVLERRKLLEASFEKALGREDSAFWNGAYLLEGAINAERIQGDEIRIDARLMPRAGGAAVPFAVKGWRTNLAELGSQCVGEIRRALKLNPTPMAWTPETEAKRFYDHARDAVRWGFWTEAAEAADAALALGKDDLDTRQVRLRAYTGVFAINDREARWRSYKPGFGVLERYTPAPEPDALSFAVDTAYQLQEMAQLHSKLMANAMNEAVSNATLALGRFTLRFYLGAELRRGNEDKLADLRAAMRAFTDSTLATLEAANAMIPLLVDYGPLWQETPEDGVKLHQRLRALPGFALFEINSGRFSAGPDADADSLDWTPRLCGWKWSDRSRVDTVWEAFKRTPRPKPEGEPGRVLMRMPPLGAAGFRGNTNRPTGSPRPSIAGATTNITRVASSPATPQADFELTSRTLVVTNGMWRQLHRLAYEEGKLWVFFEAASMKQFSTERSGSSRRVTEYLLVSLSGSGSSETISIPEKFLSFHENKGAVQFAIFPDRVIFFLEQEGLAYDRSRKAFTAHSSPIKSPSVYRSGGRLFLYNEETVLETTAELKDYRVLASVRRRLALNPLDELTLYQKPVLTGAGGQLLFAFEGGVYRRQKDQWQRAAGTTLDTRAAESEKIPVSYGNNEILIREEVTTHGGGTACRAYYYGPRSPEAELWWGGIRKEAKSMPPVEVVESEPQESGVRYPMLPAVAPFHYLQGRFAGISRQVAFPFRGHLVTLTLTRNPRTPGLLELWLPNRPRPVAFSVLFGEGFPVHDSRLMLAGDDIYFWGSQASKIWHLEGDDILSRIGNSVSPEANRNKQ